MSNASRISWGTDCTLHYGLPGQLADYRHQFEKTTRKAGEDPSIFAMALETLVVKAFGDMCHTARLRIIRDRFIAGHDSCDLRRHLDSVSPETPIQDIVDRCRVWASHADSDTRRFSKPGTERALPIFTVDEPGCGRDDGMVAHDSTSPTAPDQLETLLRWLLPAPVVPTPPHKPVPSALEQLLQHLLMGARALKPVPPTKTGISNIDTLLQSLLPGIPASAVRTQPGPI